MSEAFKDITSQPELVGLGGDIIQEHKSALQQVSYRAIWGPCGFEPPASVGLTMGTSVPEASLVRPDDESGLVD